MAYFVSGIKPPRRPVSRTSGHRRGRVRPAFLLVMRAGRDRNASATVKTLALNQNVYHPKMHNVSNQDKSRIKSMLYFAKWRNRERKTPVPFDLTIEWALERWTGRCEITGLPFEVRKVGGPNPFSPSIDRIIADKGSTQDNCRFVLFGIPAAIRDSRVRGAPGRGRRAARRLLIAFV